LKMPKYVSILCDEGAKSAFGVRTTATTARKSIKNIFKSNFHTLSKSHFNAAWLENPLVALEKYWERT